MKTCNGKMKSYYLDEESYKRLLLIIKNKNTKNLDFGDKIETMEQQLRLMKDEIKANHDDIKKVLFDLICKQNELLVHS